MKLNKRLNTLAAEFLKNRDTQEMIDFLKGILTPKELEELSTRLEIVTMLKHGEPQHVIAKKLGVGVATVTRGSKELQQGRFKNV
jgi:TrpR family transcriptional regulator, trp operon repressor